MKILNITGTVPHDGCVDKITETINKYYDDVIVIWGEEKIDIEMIDLDDNTKTKISSQSIEVLDKWLRNIKINKLRK